MECFLGMGLVWQKQKHLQIFLLCVIIPGMIEFLIQFFRGIRLFESTVLLSQTCKGRLS